jgi:hypothetical protein
MKRTAGAPPRTPKVDVPADIEAEILKDLEDRHYREWLDQPIPALRNHTPREAARSKALRPFLRDLLEQLENYAERAKVKGRFAYDSGWLWTELGLRRRPSRSDPRNVRQP